MAAATQDEADRIVARCRRLAAKHGGQSPVLAEVRKWYAAFHACPEHGAMVALEAAMDKVDALPGRKE